MVTSIIHAQTLLLKFLIDNSSDTNLKLYT